MKTQIFLKAVAKVFWRIVTLPMMIVAGVIYGIVGMFSPRLLALMLKRTGESALGIEPLKRNKIIATDAVREFYKYVHPDYRPSEQTIEDWYDQEFKNHIPEEFY
jgi:hypothetical protein